MATKPNISVTAAELRRRAEGRLVGSNGHQKLNLQERRLLHELEVHKIELEMQNDELQRARDELELALENYTDLYDFAPVGYFSIDESGTIRESNLTGAALLGIERSRLVNRRMGSFVSPESQPVFLEFLKRVFTSPKNHQCEALLLRQGGGAFWAEIRATAPVPPLGTRRLCRVVFGDISTRKQAEEAQRRIKSLGETNLGLNREIARRQKVESALQKSKRNQSQLLRQARFMQEKLRHLSHQILLAQEEERKRISRELHDKIAQTLVGIHVHLHALSRDAERSPKNLREKIARTQRHIKTSMGVVHRFAWELRPTVLDDLGLIPALQAFMKEFTKRTGVLTHLKAFEAIEQTHIDGRTVLYRIALEALNNVARHAQAGRVEVIIEKLPDRVSMKIKDDGKSFDVDVALHAKGHRHLGLLGMRERLEMVGGHFDIESALGQGTTIIAQIPLSNARKPGGGGAIGFAPQTSS